MKLEISNFSGNLPDSFRSLGYRYDGPDLKTKELRFYKSVSGGLFPRFHVYCVWDQKNKKVSVSLHLDQKAPVYEGATAHGGDYEGPVIEKEGQRIKTALLSNGLSQGLDMFE